MEGPPGGRHLETKGQCCRCNGNGTCYKCKCAKENRKCTSCAPGRKSNCKNTVTVREEPAVSTVPKPGAAQPEQLGFASPNRRSTANTHTAQRTPVSGATTADDIASAALAAAMSNVSSSQQLAWNLLESAEPSTSSEVSTCKHADDVRPTQRDTTMRPATTAETPESLTSALLAECRQETVSNSQQLAWDILDQQHDTDPCAIHTHAQAAAEPTTEEVALLANLEFSQSQLAGDPGIHIRPRDETNQDMEPNAAADLPDFPADIRQDFSLGTMDKELTMTAIREAYAEGMHFRPNTFSPPRGTVGKSFVAQLAQYLACFGNGGVFEGAALQIAMTFQLLLLQKPPGANPNTFTDILQRRMETWNRGDICDLRQECRTIQRQLNCESATGRPKVQDSARHFASLVTDGKISAALRQLDGSAEGGLLKLDDQISEETVRHVLKAKHPEAAPLSHEALMQGPFPTSPHPVRFEKLNRDAIRQVVLHTNGAAGPSGVDAATWHSLCTSFADASDALCDSLACCARRLATKYVNPSSLEAYLASRLVPLAKNPGVRPIGIGEVIRRVIGKAILSIIGNDIQEAAGSQQLCAGQDCGIEATIHAMTDVYNSPDVDGVLMADASNAFNSLNRAACIHNIRLSCPALATVVINCYRSPANLHVGGETIQSREGTTQGDPLAMPIYAIGILPLITSVATDGACQHWYADDSSAGGKMVRLKVWWDRLLERGPAFGYQANPSKSVLVVKPECLDEARRVFAGSGIRITDEGHRYLGAAIGTPEYCQHFVQKKCEEWLAEVAILTEYARTQPQAAYSAFTRGLQHKWTFICRTLAGAAEQLGPLERHIATELIPVLTGQHIDQEYRSLIGFPCRHGGLGLADPTSLSSQYSASRHITTALVHQMNTQAGILGESLAEVRDRKGEVRREQRRSVAHRAMELANDASPPVKRAMELGSEKGASSWLTCRPLARHGFTLSKAQFRDGLALRYGWHPDRLPSTCSCGATFTVAHALSCATGGFIIMRHNEVRDLTAQLLGRVAHDVNVEPTLPPLTGENLRYRTAVRDDLGRLDVVASGIYGGRFERSYLDVRVFNPHAPSNRSSSAASCYKRHEREKRRAYGERVQHVERAGFIPVVFSAHGGMGNSAISLYKRIASMLSEKTREAYSSVMAWIRARLSFALLRASVACLRGARRPIHCHRLVSASAALAVAEARIVV